uniref:Uncharacterized protein TCIL3000_11_13070 n=1 Tax=Trypanosoma congolense (strain IL3000) TaxID=1068625 RepID=G0V2D6_TRYCI|nr:unnamed protein product [Trypanosoma congolense IL3000]
MKAGGCDSRKVSNELPPVLPWWKRLALDSAYRKRIRKIATERYNSEMRLLHHFPHELSAAVRDFGAVLPVAAQYICLEADCQWSNKHPSNVVKASSVEQLRDSANVTVLPALGENLEERIDNEVKRLFLSEEENNRLYGLSYIWDKQFPPMGFIRQWPLPHKAMWPSSYDETPSKIRLPSDKAALRKLISNPLCIHIYRRNGEFLGVWRQSLMLLRYKVICCALHEEAEEKSPYWANTDNPQDTSHLEGVPRFTVPLLKLQQGTAVIVGKGKVELDSIRSPTSWEGIAPSPPDVQVDQGYLNWCTLHNNSPMVRQSLRDVYNMLPHDRDGMLSKETFVDFVLDLLNLFFPVNDSASNIAVAEEEWAFRGTSDKMSFDAFFEKFFNFPFIFLRNFEGVTRDKYIEVWCLIRVCLLETKYTIHLATSDITHSTEQSPRYLAGQDQGSSSPRVRRGVIALNKSDRGSVSTLCRIKNTATLRATRLENRSREFVMRQKNIPNLIGGIEGLGPQEIINLGCTSFYNTDNYKMFVMKRDALREFEKGLRVATPGRQVLLAHKKAERQLVQEVEEDEYSEYLSTSVCVEGAQGEAEAETPSASSSSVCSRSATLTGGNGVTKTRRAVLEELEDRHTLGKILATSTWYRRRREQRKKRLNDAYTLVSRCHTSWDMYGYDIYAPPEGNVTEINNLITFVLELPDDFFEIENPLRMRNAVYRAYENFSERRLNKVSRDNELKAIEEKLRVEMESAWLGRIASPMKPTILNDSDPSASLEREKRESTATAARRDPVDDECDSPCERTHLLPKSPLLPAPFQPQTAASTGTISLFKPPTGTLLGQSLQQQQRVECSLSVTGRVTAHQHRARLEREEKKANMKEKRAIEARLDLVGKLGAEFLKRTKPKPKVRGLFRAINATQRKL